MGNYLRLENTSPLFHLESVRSIVYSRVPDAIDVDKRRGLSNPNTTVTEEWLISNLTMLRKLMSHPDALS